MTASSLAPGTIAPSERVGASVVSATIEEAVTFSARFDRRLARLFAVESSTRARDARGVIAAVRESSGWIRLCFNIDVAGSEGPNSSLLAMCREARLICWAPEARHAQSISSTTQTPNPPHPARPRNAPPTHTVGSRALGHNFAQSTRRY